MEIKDAPLFSVLIANYNNGKYLLRAVDSVRCQTYNNWEIIIVDDCSTDNSNELYDVLKNDERIHIYYNDKNMGVGFTKHYAASKANCELVGILDPDDALLPNAIELETNVHLQHPEVSIVCSKSLLCDSNLTVLKEGKTPVIRLGSTYYDENWRGIMHFTSFKKSCYEKTDGIGIDLRANDDLDLYLKLEEVGKVYCLDEFAYKYVVSGQGTNLSRLSNYSRLLEDDMKVRYRACTRRGLNLDVFFVPEMSRLIEHYIGCLVWEKEKEVRSSWAYRVGKVAITPLTLAKKVIKK